MGADGKRPTPAQRLGDLADRHGFLAAAVLVALGGATALALVVGSSGMAHSATPILAVWALIVGLTGLTLAAAWGLASAIIGAGLSQAYGFRLAALMVSLLIAGAVSPPAMRDLFRMGESVTRLAVISTPSLALAVTAEPGAKQKAAGGDEDPGALAPEKAALLLLDCVKRDWPRHGQDAVTTTDAGNSFCRATPIRWEAKPGDGFMFGAALLLCLVLSRSLYESYQRQYGMKAADGHGGGDATVGKPVIGYGQWLALIVYSAILVPAAYLAVGSLVLLQTAQPQAPPGLGDVYDAAVPAQNEPLAQAVEQSYGEVGATTLRLRVIQAAAGLDETFVTEAYRARARLTPSDYGDRVAVLKRWRAVDREALAADLRSCSSAEASERAGVTKAGAGAGAVAPAAAPPPSEPPVSPVPAPAVFRGGTSLLTPVVLLRERPRQDPAQTRTPARDAADAGAADPCAITPVVDFTAPTSLQSGNLGLIDRVYPWLGADRYSRPILLMMGLLGFGLVGAAIRAMASSDNLIDDSGMGDKEARLDAGRFGAIIVNAVGAAMVVFLASQAGALIFTGQPAASSGLQATGSPFPQLLFCFLGAVFAKEVWAWGGDRLRSALARPGRPSALESLGQRRDAASARAAASALAARTRARSDAKLAAAAELKVKPLETSVAAGRTAADKALVDADAAWSTALRANPINLAAFNAQLAAAEQAVAGLEQAATALDDGCKPG